MFDFDNLNFDMDGDGVTDTYVGYTDTNGEGIMDAAVYAMDTNGDGALDTVLVDLDQDGTLDGACLDSDADGHLDMCMMDTDGDALPDTALVDRDGDGEFEVEADISGLVDDVMEFDVSTSMGTPMATPMATSMGTSMGAGDDNGVFNFDGLNTDLDEDGTPDSYAGGADFDRDGVDDADILALDLNGDGEAETVLVDIDQDGELDAIYEDLDKDGIFESCYVDTDGDSVTDMVMVDVNGDGIYDEQISGTYEPAPAVTEVESAAGEYMEDTNGDGVPDIIYQDTDGVADTILQDTDYNGEIDVQMSSLDTNNDGVEDQLIRQFDYDQDGIFETVQVYSDTDGDGLFDQVSRILDTDGNGTLDHFETGIDLDGDEQADINLMEDLFDTDGDGVEDTYLVQADTDGDNVFDVVELYDYDPYSGVIELIASENLNVQNAAVQLDNFEPEETRPEDVCGDPASSMSNWECQGATNRCTLYSQKFVIEDLTGKDIPIEEIVKLAEEHGWFTEEGGGTALNMNKVLDYYGVENEMTFHADFEDIKHCLENGGKVIVAVDSGEIWSGEVDNIFSPLDGADHAVQVIGIDYSDPDNPMVILNDSGTPNGCGEMVPLDMFMDAWSDSDCQMVSCY